MIMAILKSHFAPQAAADLSRAPPPANPGGGTAHTYHLQSAVRRNGGELPLLGRAGAFRDHSPAVGLAAQARHLRQLGRIVFHPGSHTHFDFSKGARPLVGGHASPSAIMSSRRAVAAGCGRTQKGTTARITDGKRDAAVILPLASRPRSQRRLFAPPEPRPPDRGAGRPL